ncbi:MAG: PKD-like domain-containing protein [Flavobacterium sp.]
METKLQSGNRFHFANLLVSFKTNTFQMLRLNHGFLSQVFILFILLSGSLAWGQDTGWLNPTTNPLNNGVSNPTNVYSSNNSRATFESGDYSDYGGFSVSIPAGAIINGIEVRVEGYRSSILARNLNASLSYNNGNNYTATSQFGINVTSAASEAYFTVGGNTSLWGRTWTISELGNANFRIRLTTSGSLGSVSVDHLQVRIFYTFALTITNFSPSSGCQGSSITINGTNLSGATAVTIGGTAVSSITSNSATQIIAVVGSGTTGTVSVTTPNGTATSAGTFTVNAPPAITTAATPAVVTAVCQSASNQTTTMAYTATTGTPTSYSIDWATLTDQGSTAFAFAAGGGSVTGITVPAGTPAGTYTGTMTITNANGCTATKAVTLTVNTPSIAPTGATGTITICNGGSTTLTVAGGSKGTGAVTQWYTGACGTGTLVFTGDTLNTGVLTANTTYYVRYSGTCNTTTCATVTVTVTPNVGTPTAITVSSGTEPTCKLTNGTTTTTYATTATNNTGFNWSLSNPAAGNINASTGVMTWANGFSGSVNIQVTANGCNGPTSPAVIRTVTVNPSPTAFNVTGTGSYCSGDSGPEVGLDGSSSGVNYQLYNGATPIGSPVAGTDSAISFGLQTGTNTYTVIATDTTTLCTSTMLGNAVVTLIPTVGTPTAITVSAGTEPTCQLPNGTTTTTYATTATNNTGFNWSLSNPAAGNINASTGVMTWANGFSGNVDFQVTANGCNGPSSQVVRTVTVTPTVGTPTAITVSAGVEPACQLANGTTTTTYATTATNNSGFNWSLSNPAAGNINASTGVMTWANGFSGNVDFQVTANGCNGPSSQVVRTVTIMTNSVGTASATPALCINTALTAITHATTGATGIANAGVSGANGLPAGVSATWGANVITISGTPTVSGIFNYSIPLTGSCDSINATGTITVDPLPTVNLTSAGSTANQTLCVNSGLTNITYSVGGSATGATVSGLPSGVNGNYTAGIFTISGIPATSGTFNYTVSTTGGTCLPVTLTGTINVNPLPAASGVISGTATVCQGQNGVSYSVPAIANATGYNWTLPPGATIILGANTNSIIVDFGMSATSGNITVFGTNACGNGVVSANYAVAVNISSSIITNYTPFVCSGNLVTVSPTNGGGNIVPVGTTYSWSLPIVTGGITGGTAMSGQTSFSQTLINPTNTLQTASYNVTASTAGCSANSFSVLVTVYPTPTVSGTPAPQSVCSGNAITAITLSNPNNISGAIDYSWTRDNNSNVTGMPNTGTGTTISGNLSNATNSPQTTVFTAYATSQNGCISSPFTMNVLVNPIPILTITPSTAQTICSGDNISAIVLSNPNNVAGTTYSWTRTNTANVTGISDESGASITGSLINTTNTAQTTIFTIKATANGCDSAITTVSIIVNPKPSVAVSLASQTVCGGTFISPIIITNPNNVAETTYSWTRDNTTNVSGLLSGTVSPISGTLFNNVSSDQNTIFTVIATAGTCSSTTTSAVFVKHSPLIVATPSSQTKCNAIALTNIVLSDANNPSGTTYTWTRNKTAELTGMAASGSGNSISGTLTNTTTVTQTVTFIITATASNGCNNTNTATVIVYPKLVAPVISASQDVCNFQTPSPFLMSTPVSGGSGSYSYQWQRSTRNSGGPWTNVGTNLPTFNPPTNEYDYRLIVTDSFCTSNTVISNVIYIRVLGIGGILDAPTVSNAPGSPVCNGAIPPITVDISHTALSAVKFNWYTNNGYVTPATGGPVGNTTGGIIRNTSYTLNFTAANNTNATVNTIVTIVPNFDNGLGNCNSTATTINLQIRPTPVVTATTANTTICNTTSAGITLSSSVTDAATTFNWSVNNNTNITGDNTSGTSGSVSAGGTFTINNVLTNNSTSAQSVIYTITPVSNGCSGTPVTVTITVIPTVAPGTVVADQTICNGGDPVAFTQSVAATGINLTYQWRNSTIGTTGPWTDISGATAITYDVPAGLTQDTWYQRVVTSTLNGGICSVANTTPIKVSINTINPGSIIGNQTVCSGMAPAPFTSVGATGSGAITYKWYSSTTDCNGSWTLIAGATGATYAPSGITTTTYYRREAISTNSAVCNAFSNCITVIVNTVNGGTVGADQTVCSPYNPSLFTNIVSGSGSGIITYQWQSNTAGCGGSWNDISGATGATYDAPSGLSATTYYRRVAISTLNGSMCSAYSNCVTVTRNFVSAGSITNGNITICSGGDPVAFNTTAATGTALTYQWQFSLNGGALWTDIGGALGTTYDAPGPITQKTDYRIVAISTINGQACSDNSSFISVFPNNITASTVAGDQAICSGGDPVAFTVTTAASGTGTLTYQWQSNTTGCGGSWTNIAGATSEIYDIPSGLTTTTYYHLVITSTLNGVACTAESNCITVSVNTLPTITGTLSVCVGSTITLTGSGIPDAVIPWSSITTSIATINSAGLIMGVAEGTSIITYKDNKGCTKTATITVNGLPPAPVQAITQPTCILETGSVVLSGLPLGGILNPGSVSYSGTTYTISGLTAGSYDYTVSNGTCTSLPVNVMINAQPPTPVQPVLNTVTQPTCSIVIGSFGIANYNASYTYVVTPSVGVSISGNTITALSGSYTVVATLGSCTSIPSEIVTVNAQPTAPIITTQPVIPAVTCSGSGTQTISVAATGSGLIYSWRKGSVAVVNGGAISGQGTATLVLTDPLSADAGSYDVVVSGTCAPAVTSNAVIVAVKSLPDNVTTGFSSSSFCVGEQATITFDANNLSGVPPYTLIYRNNTTLVTASVTIANDNPTSFNVTPNPASTTNYTLLSITDANGCVNSSPSDSTAQVTIKALPSAPTIGTILQPTCYVTTGSVVLSGLPTGIWTINPNGITGSTISTTISGLTEGIHNFTVINASGCTSTVSADVTIVPLITKTWNGGSWSPSAPSNIDDLIVFEGNYSSTGNLVGCTCAVKSGNVVINSLHTLSLQKEIVVTGGTFTLEKHASLIQVTGVSNSGLITVKRDSTPMMMYDYTYWSSPTSGTQTLKNFAPQSNPKFLLTYDNQWVYMSSSAVFSPAIGYAILAPDGNYLPKVFSHQFVGVPNNGDISVPVTYLSSQSTKLVGNPYPSAIDADKFITANSATTTGTLYFWTHNHVKTTAGYSDDYAVYNTTGGTAVLSGHGNINAPTKWIASGQGFVVGVKATGNVVFNNSMRIGGSANNNTNFYRSSSIVNSEKVLEKHRIWLNLLNDDNAFSQALVGYVESATNGHDFGFDGLRIGENELEFYSLIDKNPYVIQARALPFSNNDEVLLGYKTTKSGNFKIAIDNVDGLFGNIDEVIIEDKLLGISQNIKDKPYNFRSDSGVFNNRFVLKYGSTVSDLNDLGTTSNEVVILSNDHKIHIQSKSEPINQVFVYDMLGRQIFENKKVNLNTLLINNLSEKQVLVVKVVLDNGQTITKKIIN